MCGTHERKARSSERHPSLLPFLRHSRAHVESRVLEKTRTGALNDVQQLFSVFLLLFSGGVGDAGSGSVECVRAYTAPLQPCLLTDLFRRLHVPTVCASCARSRVPCFFLLEKIKLGIPSVL